MATDSNNLKLARITAAKAAAFASAVIAAGSVYWHEVQKRIRIGDGTTAGGLGVAMESELIQNGPTLTEEKQEAGLESLGVFSAIGQVITENGGTVPQNQSLQTLSLGTELSNPWAELA